MGLLKNLEICVCFACRCSRSPLSVVTVMRWQVAARIKLLYHRPLGAASCITAMSAADQYDAGPV